MAARADRPLAVVIPAYQVADAVRRVIADVRAVVPAARIIVVDDGSTDGTAFAAATDGVAVHRSTRNRGKGAALGTGIADAVRGGAEWIVTLDADGQHLPSAIPRLLERLEGAADVALGARVRGGAMPLSRRASNWLSSVLVSRVAGCPVPDAQTGFRAFTRTVAERVRPGEGHYEWELSFLLGALAAGFRVDSVEVPTLYGARSHFRSVVDTWRIARVFARHGARILRGKR